MKCDNDSSMGQGIIAPQCLWGKATKQVTVQYNEVERDVLNLCEECAAEVTKDARRHGYKTQTKNL